MGKNSIRTPRLLPAQQTKPEPIIEIEISEPVIEISDTDIKTYIYIAESGFVI